MKFVGPEYTDYWLPLYVTQRTLKNRFGIRLANGHCWALVKVSNQEPQTFGEPYVYPLEISSLPIWLRMIVADHQLNFPSSDLLDILTGTSLDKPLDSANDTELKRMTASAGVGSR